MGDEEPTWRPLSDVAMLTEISRQGVEHARDAHELLAVEILGIARNRQAADFRR